MRQREEQQVAGLHGVGMDELQAAHPAHVRVDAVDVVPDVLPAGDLGEFHAGMKMQQPQQFAAGVAAAAHNPNRRHVRTRACAPLACAALTA